MVPEIDLTLEQLAEQKLHEQAFLEHRAANAPVKHKSAKKTATALKNLVGARHEEAASTGEEAGTASGSEESPP